TWEWNGLSWTQRPVAGPSPRYNAAMAYDSARRQTLLYGGVGGGGNSADFWSWGGFVWTQIAGQETLPGFRGSPSMAFDPNSATLVLDGGPFTATWDGHEWTAHANGLGPAAKLAYDPTQLTVVGVLQSNAASSNTYRFETDGWHSLSITLPQTN